MSEQTASDLISVPKGGGALSGLGESFQPDLHTGTGNMRVPLPLPSGRNGLTPSLALTYSTGSPNGPFGLGWSLTVPGIRRKTAKGVPRYDDSDVFVLSGAEDLVAVTPSVKGGDGLVRRRYRPKTESAFARITHVTGSNQDYWDVRSKDGLRSLYGAPTVDTAAGWADPFMANPNGDVFAWLLGETVDAFGNRITYRYQPDQSGSGQLYVVEVTYADHGNRSAPQYLISVRFDRATRPDPFSDRKPGFELRTTERVSRIEIWTQADIHRHATTVDLTYADERGDGPPNGVSLLEMVTVSGHDGAADPQRLPPLEFRYTPWEPASQRQFQSLAGELPLTSLKSANSLDLVDLFGDGLPSILQLNGASRYWRNRGDGTFDPPRGLSLVPGGAAIGDPGVQLADIDADGRPELIVSTADRTGFWPLTAGEDRAGFGPYVSAAAPTFGLADPLLRFIDLDGDGRMDLLRSGSSYQLAYNDGNGSFSGLQPAPRGEGVPPPTLNDPRIRLADMTGDQLTDIVLVYDGNIRYWPNLGYGRWGEPVTMKNSPRFGEGTPYGTIGFDPDRLLQGDVDGDGCADLVYVGDGVVTVWVNQSGNGFSTTPVVIRGTPRVNDTTSVRLADIFGTGISGLLWTADATTGRARYAFLDLNGQVKPHLLDLIDNHHGAVTTIGYATSTSFALADREAKTPWATTLPFPVHVVARTIVTDYFSQTTLSSEYAYHHGYWDGADREFRGFGRADQRDTLAPIGATTPHVSPPTETRSWFHLGPVGPEFGAWQQVDLSGEYWQEDLPLAPHVRTEEPIGSLGRRSLRDAVRAARGQLLRQELYALDDGPLAGRPYEVIDNAFTLAPVLDDRSPDDTSWRAAPVVGVRQLVARTATWERSYEPITKITITDQYDDYGQATSVVNIAVPRRRDPRVALPWQEPYLATYAKSSFAQRDEYGPSMEDGLYIVDRVCRTITFEVANDGTQAALELAQSVLDGSAVMTLIGETITFFDGDAYRGRPFGELGDHGAPARTEQLVLTQAIIDEAYRDERDALATPPYLAADPAAVWGSDYPEEFQALLPLRAGYANHSTDTEPEFSGGYYAPTERRKYDFQASGVTFTRGLVTGRLNPLGNETSIEFDAFDLLPVAVTDPSGLLTTATYDMRTLRPSEIVDPNGNPTAIGYTPLGLVAWVKVTGKQGEGDAEEPSTRFEYVLDAFDPSRQPMSVKTVRRVYHDTELAIPESDRDDTITKAEFTDGFGRLLQTRSQAERVLFGVELDGDRGVFGDAGLPADQKERGGPAVGVASAGDPFVVVSGWQLYDNKGRVIDKYEPFFATGWTYNQPSDEERGTFVRTHYDALGRPARVASPDLSEQLIIRGVPGSIENPSLENPLSFEPTPWVTYTYDANDNAGRTHPDSSKAYESHWNTPASTVVDALGRTIEAVERNGADESAWYVTASTYDIRGNLISLVDPLGRTVTTQTFGFSNRAIRTVELDAGLTRTVFDAAGEVVERRDAKGALVLRATDGLSRPIRRWARDQTGELVTLRERFDYANPSLPGSRNDPAVANNLLGRLVAQYDEAGLIKFEQLDFKGNLLEKVHRVISDETLLAPVEGSAPIFRVDWSASSEDELDSLAESILESAEYRTSTVYDALNRVTRLAYPKDVDGARKMLRLGYEASGALVSATLDDTPYVERIAYNAKGQRVLLAFGNTLMTRYAYDPLTFRLLRLRTEHFSSDGLSYMPSGVALQDFGYEYDLVGNILWIHDRTPECGVPPDPDKLDREFIYEPIYRLRSASGRQTAAEGWSGPWDPRPRSVDLTKAERYQEIYKYDRVGNLLTLTHMGQTSTTVRAMELVDDSNKLAKMDIGGTPYVYTYGPTGAMTSETTSRQFDWDHSDRMRFFGTQAENSEPSVHAQYLYDPSGQRVKKLVRKGHLTEVTIYIEGILEHHRRVRPSRTEENDLLHIMDGLKRITLFRVGDAFSNDRSPSRAYQLADHLGSSNVVADGSGAETNREEYTPYGETSFGSFAQKRYRFGGTEREEESGLAYHSARYYSSWLTRWISADPAGLPDGPNTYVFARCAPTRFSDPFGRQSIEEYERAKTPQERVQLQANAMPPQVRAQNMAAAAAGLPEFYSESDQKRDKEPWMFSVLPGGSLGWKLGEALWGGETITGHKVKSPWGEVAKEAAKEALLLVGPKLVGSLLGRLARPSRLAPTEARALSAGIDWRDTTAPEELWAVGSKWKTQMPFGGARKPNLAGYNQGYQWDPVWAGKDPAGRPLVVGSDPVTGAQVPYRAADRPVGLYEFSARPPAGTQVAASTPTPQPQLRLPASRDIQYYSEPGSPATLVRLLGIVKDN